jgi:hypothetical protein
VNGLASTFYPLCIILNMEKPRSPEFAPDDPVRSAAAVIRAIFVTPRDFFVRFSEDGPLKEPVLFVMLVTAVTATLRLVLTLIFGSNDAASVGVSVVEAVVFVVLSPAIVGVFAGAYLLSIRTFVGEVGNFRAVYRMVAYAYGAMVLFWVPVINAFAFTYFALILMGMAVRYAYRTSFLNATVTAMVAYVPAAMLFIFLQVAVTGFAFG